MAKDKWLLQFLAKKTSGELLFNRALECAGAVQTGLGCLSLKSRQSVQIVRFIQAGVGARGQVSPFPVFLDHTYPLPANQKGSGRLDEMQRLFFFNHFNVSNFLYHAKAVSFWLSFKISVT